MSSARSRERRAAGAEDATAHAKADAAIAAVVEALRSAPKYKNVAPAAIERIAREALAASPRPADAIRRAKSKLHQVHAAFLAPRDLDAVELLLARDVTDRAGWEALCEPALARHASTAERSRERAALYRELFAQTGPPRSVVDLGCGLHPFALPWMGLARDVPYHALDLDVRVAALVERFLGRFGQEGSARAADLLGEEPPPPADVALLMKLLPTLERQRSGASQRLLAALVGQGARALVLSFPTASLGRREKGMAARYEEFARARLDELGPGWRVTRTLAGTELFLVAVTAETHAPRRAR